MSENFSRLRGFESRELVAEYFHGLHGRDLNAERGRSIVSSFRQGRMLFESAARTEPFARPITQYYGVSAIARGLAIVLNPQGSESSLNRGHGLKIDDFPESAQELTVQTSKGLFTDFSAALGGATLRVRTSGPDWFLPLPDIAPRTLLPMSAVATLLPGLAREVRQWTGFEQPNSFGLASVTVEDGDEGRIDWKFDGQHGADEIQALFGGASIEARDGGTVSTMPDVLPQLAQQFVFEKIGHVVLRSPIAEGVRLSPLQVLFVVSFVLSMLARYRPSQWMAVFSGVGNDRMLPFVQSFLDFNQSWFPQLAVDHLQFAAKCDASMIPNTRTD